MKFPKLFEKNLIRKEVEKMKKLLSLLVAIVMVASTSGTALAAFTSDGTEAFTASSGSVGGTAGISEPFSATLKNLSDDATATDVAWTGVDAGDGWETADQYIEVTGFATYSNWGIQTYTDNEDVSASPQYTGTNNPAGLVRTDSTIYNLPVCWRTKAGYYDPVAATYSDPGSAAASSEELEIIQGRDGNYTVLYDGVTGHAPGGTDPYFPWFFILDKGTDDVDVTTTGDQAFDDYQVDATFIGSAGYHHAPGASEPLNFATPNHPQDKYYIYLGANFTLAIPAKTYTTNMLTVEMYHL